jgi:predicted Zn-dependent protease
MSVGGRWRYRWHRLRAQLCLVCGQHDAALRRFDTMLADAPHDRYALASRAHLLAQSGDRTAAVQTLRSLTAEHPGDVAGWFNLAFLLQSMEHDGEAESAFLRALDLDDALDRAWYGLALLYIRARRFDDAARALQYNTGLQPMSPFGWYQLARVELDRQRPAEALKIMGHLKGFEPRVAAQLERETGLHAKLPG